MSPLAITGIIFACIVAGTLLGMILRRILPEEHLSPETKDVVKLGMGLIGTMAALVLGLLVASAKNAFDTQRNGLAQLAGNVIFLDRALAHYGPETKEVRDQLKDAVTDMLQRTWPAEFPGQTEIGKTEIGKTEGRYEYLLEKIQELKPKTDAQRSLQSQALSTFMSMAQARWLLFAQQGSSIPTPFLIVMVFWLTLLYASFSMFAPSNAAVLITLFISAVAVSSALFLILELDQPFQGIMQISSDPLRAALNQLGR